MPASLCSTSKILRFEEIADAFKCLIGQINKRTLLLFSRLHDSIADLFKNKRRSKGFNNRIALQRLRLTIFNNLIEQGSALFTTVIFFIDFSCISGSKSVDCFLFQLKTFDQEPKTVFLIFPAERLPLP